MLSSRLHQGEYSRPGRRPGRDGHGPADILRDLRIASAEGTKRSRQVRVVEREIPSPQQEFAALVMMRIQAGVLRYSDRQALLTAAARMGIGRFDANLLIAMAQHRCKATAGPVTQPSGRWQLVAVGMVVQAAILSGFYWLLR